MASRAHRGRAGRGDRVAAADQVVADVEADPDQRRISAATRRSTSAGVSTKVPACGWNAARGPRASPPSATAWTQVDERRPAGIGETAFGDRRPGRPARIASGEPVEGDGQDLAASVVRAAAAARRPRPWRRPGPSAVAGMGSVDLGQSQAALGERVAQLDSLREPGAELRALVAGPGDLVEDRQVIVPIAQVGAGRRCSTGSARCRSRSGRARRRRRRRIGRCPDERELGRSPPWTSRGLGQPASPCAFDVIDYPCGGRVRMAARAVNDDPSSGRTGRQAHRAVECRNRPVQLEAPMDDDREERRAPAGRQPAGADHRDHRDRHLERLVRGRRARVRDLATAPSAQRPTRRSSPTSGRPTRPLARARPRARRGATRPRPRSTWPGRSSRRCRCGGAAPAAGLRGVRRPPGPALHADRPDAVPLVRPHARPGRALRSLAPNIIVKFPATSVGVRVMEEATYRGVNVNATVSFSVAQAVAAGEAVERGLRRRESEGLPVDDMGPVITVMMGRLEDWLRVQVANATASWPTRRPCPGPVSRSSSARRRVPGARPPGAPARRRHPPSPPLVGADRRRRRHHAALQLAAALQRLVRRGPAAHG